MLKENIKIWQNNFLLTWNNGLKLGLRGKIKSPIVVQDGVQYSNAVQKEVQ